MVSGIYSLYQSFSGFGSVPSELTFPCYENPPARVHQSLRCSAVPFNGAGKLLDPEWSVRSGCGREAAPGVAVPVATVDEDNGTVLWKDDVRFAGERGDVLPEPQTCAVEKRPEKHFRLSVAPAYPGHVEAALCGRMDVSHGVKAPDPRPPLIGRLLRLSDRPDRAERRCRPDDIAASGYRRNNSCRGMSGAGQLPVP